MTQFEDYREKKRLKNVNRTSETYNTRNLIYIYAFNWSHRRRGKREWNKTI